MSKACHILYPVIILLVTFDLILAPVLFYFILPKISFIKQVDVLSYGSFIFAQELE